MTDPIRILFNEVQTLGGTTATKGDGQTTKVVGDDQFDSASSTFLADSVKVGDKLTIIGGADAGSYTIAVVDSETQLHVSGEWPAGGLSGQDFTITRYDFNGSRPDAGATINGPQYGSIHYVNCVDAGLWEFQVSRPHGADPLDWIRVERTILYLDEANITDVRFSIIPPDSTLPDAPLVRDLAEWNAAGMERLLFLHGPLRLRPGCKIKLTTEGAQAKQSAEVWWERERQVRPDPTTGADVFAYI